MFSVEILSFQEILSYKNNQAKFLEKQKSWKKWTGKYFNGSNIPEKTQEFVTENFSVQILFIG